MELVRRTIERYVPLTQEEWEMVAPHWHQRQFKRGAFIAQVGQCERWFSIVESGVQRLFVEHDGSEACLAFAYDGSWCGDLDSILRRAPGRFNVQALTHSVLWSIEASMLFQLYERLPVMQRFGRLILEELLVGRATREIEQLTLSAAERFDRLMQRSPHLLQLVPQKDIASYLGMTPETFSRLRARVR
ncbi:MAG: Crp/Fnr family transcriptional regulator [Flavobacteriales bacterium]|nr:Crp/Fnr family transcriptional regulator [Flavobacteriales bacterium]